MSEPYVTIARIVKPQGRHGEVAAELHTDFPERFAERRRLYALDAKGGRRELELEDFWGHKGRVVLKFAGVDSIDDAEKLVGCEVQIPAGARAELEGGAEYVSELVGCALVDFGPDGDAPAREVGTVRDVQFGAGEAPLLVVGEGKNEKLIPFAEAYLKRVDVAGKRIETRLPPGMLELDAPLRADEKAEQKAIE